MDESFVVLWGVVILRISVIFVLRITQLGRDFFLAFFKRIGDIFDKDQAKDSVFVDCRVEV